MVSKVVWQSVNRHPVASLQNPADVAIRPGGPLKAPFHPPRAHILSAPASVKKPVVRKHRKNGRYKSEGYSRTFQAVGWRHCLPGGNSLPGSIFRRGPSNVARQACSIGLLMLCAEGQAAARRGRSRSVLYPHPPTALHSGCTRCSGMGQCDDISNVPRAPCYAFIIGSRPVSTLKDAGHATCKHAETLSRIQTEEPEGTP